MPTVSNKLFALLVGINDYPAEVGKLEGCLNDVDHMRAFLSANFDPAVLAIEVLKDADATRGNVIGQFRAHLAKAGPGDVALLHYCGHGSRWSSAAPFREFYSDGWDEGLVCIDSLSPGGYGLVDKELAVLIAELGKNSAHVAVILDCCHSGSGTRDIDAFGGMKARVATVVPNGPRPLESYVDGYYSQLLQAGESLAIPASKHILLAACERTQTAKEMADKSGVFTSTLVEVLQATRGDLTYSDLFVRSRAAVRKRADNQLPQFEAIGNFSAASGFLGRTARNTGRRYSLYFDTGIWKMEAGAIEGIPADPDKTVSLTLYPESDPAKAAGTAHTVRVAPQNSEVQLNFTGDPTERYQAEVTSLPVAPLIVHCPADLHDRDMLRQTLEADRTVNVLLSDVEAGTRYALAVEGGNLLLKNRERDRVIRGVSLASGTMAEVAGAMLTILRSVAQWERARALANPATKLDFSQIDFEFAEQVEGAAEHVYPPGEIILDYSRNASGWQPIRGKLRVRNRSPQVLHFALFYYSSSFGVINLKNDPIQPDGATVTVWGEQPNDNFFLNEGADEAIDDFKIIVSTEKIDDHLLTQDSLAAGVIVDARALPASRDIGTVAPVQKLTLRNEWGTRDLRVRTVRRLDQVGPRDAELAGGKITIKGHASVQANLSLCAATSGGRGPADDQAFFKAFERQGIGLVNFAGTRGEDASVLEITDIQNASALAQDPLQIQLNVPLAEDEAILPVVYDGKFVLPGGDVYKDADGNTQISISKIPEVADKRRSLGGSLKLYFFKTVLKVSDVNWLRWLEYRDDGSFVYRKDGVAEKVAAARNVLLLVHGIIGDTENMALGVKACGLNQTFDLVLAFDYENLATPIEKTAQSLGAQLAEAGFAANDGKRLTLLVHSMGGLVSRWFIEREGGSALVDHLVMCGTPNVGSPFGEIDGARKVLETLVGLSMNFVPAMIPFSGGLIMVLNRSKVLTPTLEQMNPASDFIGKLNTSPDPGIPYTILAGDVDVYKSAGDPFFDALLVKVGQSAIFGALFGEKPNDIAVGVDSIIGVATQRTPAPVHSGVACHHLNYFTSTSGQEALKAVKWI
jgi:pimeloyl-ACP methyl ester carboxylesterase